MPRVAEFVALLNDIAPTSLAQEWDNVGLIVGDAEANVTAAMTCLTLSGDVAGEAIERSAQLVVAHHPVLFRPVKRLTSETSEGRLLLDLIAAGISVFSPHTGYDSAAEGINQQLAGLFELSDIAALRPSAVEQADTASGGDESSGGAGRCGNLPQVMTLGEFNALVKKRLAVEQLAFVGAVEAPVRRVAIACGSAAEFVPDAKRHGCQVLLTGEARFHACLEAEAAGLALVLPGHYATERPAMVQLAARLSAAFPEVDVWPSQREHDPVRWA